MTSVNCGQRMKLMASARIQGLFLAVKDKMTALARKRGVFMAAERTDKKETPSKGCLRKVLRYTRLLIKRSSNVNRTSNCTTYHWVVTDSEESHHLNVCWN